MTKFRHHPAAVSTVLGTDVVALHTETQRYFTLNETAAVAWRDLAECADAEQIAAAFVREFDVDPAEARAHADALLTQLLRLRLVQPAVETEAPAGHRGASSTALE